MFSTFWSGISVHYNWWSFCLCAQWSHLKVWDFLVYMFIHVNRFRSGWTNVTILFPQLCHLNDCFFEWTQLCLFISFILCAFSTFAAWISMKTTFFSEFSVEIISAAEKLLWYIFHPLATFPHCPIKFIINCLAPNSFLLMIDVILRYTCYLIPLLLAEHLCHLHNHL